MSAHVPEHIMWLDMAQMSKCKMLHVPDGKSVHVFIYQREFERPPMVHVFVTMIVSGSVTEGWGSVIDQLQLVKGQRF